MSNIPVPGTLVPSVVGGKVVHADNVDGTIPSSIDVYVNGSTVAASGIATSPVNYPSISGGIISLPTPNAGRWFQHLSVPCVGCWDAQNTSGITLSGADVDSVEDWTGLGNTATGATAAKPTYSATAWSDGGPAFLFGGAQFFRANGPIAHLQSGQPRTLIVYIHPTSLGITPLLGTYSNGGTDSVYHYISAGNVIHSASKNGEHLVSAASFTANQDTIMMIVIQPGAGNSKAYVQGKQYTFADDCLTATTTSLVYLALGALVNNTGAATYFFAGSIRHISIYAGAATKDDYVAACKGLMGHPYIQLITNGNSLSGGTACEPNTYQVALDGLLRRKYNMTNAAALYASPLANLGPGPGIIRSTLDMIAGFAASEAATFGSVATNAMVKMLFGWEIVNHIGTPGVTPRIAVDALWQYAALAEAIGCPFVTGTCMENLNTMTHDLTAAVNALLIAEWRDHCHGLVRFDRCEIMQQSVSNPALFADGTHPAIPGYKTLAACMAPTVIECFDQLI